MVGARAPGTEQISHTRFVVSNAPTGAGLVTGEGVREGLAWLGGRGVREAGQGLGRGGVQGLRFWEGKW